MVAAGHPPDMDAQRPSSHPYRQSSSFEGTTEFLSNSEEMQYILPKQLQCGPGKCRLTESKGRAEEQPQQEGRKAYGGLCPCRPAPGHWVSSEMSQGSLENQPLKGRRRAGRPVAQIPPKTEKHLRMGPAIWPWTR